MKGVVPLLGFAALLLVFWGIGCYNRLQGLRAAAMTTLQLLGAALAQRNIALEQLIATLDGNLQHERAALSSTQAALHRSAALAEAAVLTRGNPESMHALAAGEAQLGAAVWHLRNLCATYADLAVNETLTSQWIALDGALSGCQFAVERYNAAADEFGLASGERPASWLAGALYFPPLTRLDVGRGGDAPT